MSIDAMHWVWTHSQAKGNARLALLAVADKAPGPDCVVRMGTTEFRQRLNASKSAVVVAVDKAIETGELEIVEPAVGSRAAAYRLPRAVGYVRPTPGARGPESGPVIAAQGSGIRTGSDDEGSGIETPNDSVRGPESGPGGSGIRTPLGPDSGPLYQTTPTRSGSKQAGEPAAPDLGPGIPEASRPLVDSITAAGVVVRWNLSSAEWFTVEALIKRSGAPALAAYAQQQAARREITYARYFLPGWRELPPLPAASAFGPDGDVIPLTGRPRTRAEQAADFYRNAAQKG
ncbi:hypothetical protein NMG29_06485 [Streptomyces cocklensis]|uniref:Helix-turn-helix domain-containing protein n=1 Tax=Actinacidiphila cocklensis TaxID=887465 RepID=A0A9W4DM80_9ACTN|nr:hypothetical protein [Actinacidiphila cocklensis]MDD1057878.1 hypothetical protein [Actinacidiphila cocklensis]CAG6392739.1 conserved hypothetical protein [Actinacidiphila cocklensis]